MLASSSGTSVTAASGPCIPFFTCTDKVLAARDIVGVAAFRGWWGRSQGVRNVFKVETGTTQRWQNGYRASAGAFGVSGTTDRYVAKDNGGGQADTWPQRGDCWDPPAPGDDPVCSFIGFDTAYGRDTWRWEKHQHVNPACSFATCVPFIYEEEHLNQRFYVGGTEQPGHFGPVSYYYKPSEIRAGQLGNWARYLPGSQLDTFLNTAVEYSNSASFSVSESESFTGEVSFTSSMVHQRSAKVTTTQKFRPANELAFMDGYYRYDGNHSFFQWEYWSCEWAPGWSGPQDYTNCWNFGS